MREATKAQKRHLRELASKAHERELAAALKELQADFGKWQAAQITAWELNERIHKHHDGISRELFSVYSNLKPDMAVARAVFNKVIAWDEVREDCRPLLESMVAFFEGQRG